MFGYVKADISKLSDEQTEQYRAVYCGLCFSLKKNFGAFSRYLLNYDITLLGLVLLDAENTQEPAACKQVFCPYKMKKCTVVHEQPLFFYCACVLIILAYEKILDNIRDEAFFKRQMYRFLALFMGRKYKKAQANCALISDKVRQNMILQQQYEAGNPSLDQCAHPTADSLGTVFAGERKSEPLYQFGYALGRWIYFTDAADDLEKDKRTGAFNPFAKGESKQRIGEILNLSAGQAAQAYAQMKKGAFAPIIENIIYEGTLQVQQKVLKEKPSESI